MIRDHQPLEIVAYDVGRSNDHCNDIISHGIHLAVEFQASHPIADVDQAGTLVSGHHFFPILEGGQENDPRLDRNLLVILGSKIIGVKRTGFSLVKGLFSAFKHLLDPYRDLVAGLFHFGYRLAHPEGIPGFKGAHLPRKTPFHGIIYIYNVVSYFGNTVG